MWFVERSISPSQGCFCIRTVLWREYKKVLWCFPPWHSPHIPKPLVQCLKQDCGQCCVSHYVLSISLVDFSSRALNTVFLRNIIIIEHYLPWIVCRLKPIKVLKQTLWKVAVSSVLLIFKIFASGIQDTVDCLLYYVNLEHKRGHSSNRLLVRM